jgi:hypothetical protein
MNAFLTILYKQETRLSNLLAKFNFDPQQIDSIRTQYLERLVCACISFIRECIISGRDGERLYHIVSRRFGFDGQPADSLQRLGDCYGISRERVRQLEQRAVRKCRSKTMLQRYETHLQTTFSELVGPPRAGIASLQIAKNYIQTPQSIDGVAITLSSPDSWNLPAPDKGSTTSKLGKIRQIYPRAYTPWTAAEDEDLRQRYTLGATIEELVTIFQRQPGGIRSRLTKLG